MSGWLELVAGAAFMTGLAGGAHCAAMCGGIVAACTGSGGRQGACRWGYVLAYNTGRIASYTAAGIAAGALGQSVLLLRGGTAAAPLMLFAAGISMLLLALYVSGFAPFVRRIEALGSFVWRRVQPYSRYLLPANTVPKAFALGALWGWLPCAMVYSVLLLALTSGDAYEGGLIMAAFGAGTLPNVLGLSLIASRLRGVTRKPLLRVGVAVLVAGMGLLALTFALSPHSIAADSLLCRIAPTRM
jgi:uncharacterized protein